MLCNLQSKKRLNGVEGKKKLPVFASFWLFISKCRSKFMGLCLFQTLGHCCWRWLLFPWVHILLPEATVVFVAECVLWFSNFCLCRKAAGFQFTIPLNPSFQPIKLRKKKIKPTKEVILIGCCDITPAVDVHVSCFANRKRLLFLFPSRPVLLFFCLSATFLEKAFLLSYF